MYQAALQTSSSGDGRSQSLAWDCSASPRNYNYKRYYQPGTGRYISVDPARDDLEYGYVGAKPMASADPTGLLTIIVHGTYAEDARWAELGNPFHKAVSEYFQETAIDFDWSGGNNAASRRQAALDLAARIGRHEFSPGEKLNIVAHSHGGNVVKLLTQLGILSRKIDTFIALGTPQRRDADIRCGTVVHYINVFSTNDYIQILGGGRYEILGQEFGPAGRVDPKATNVDISYVSVQRRTRNRQVRDTYLPVGHSTLHSRLVWQELVHRMR